VDAFFTHHTVRLKRFERAGVRPASRLLGAARLAFPELLVELEATAAA
jgi:enamine deaminase RidA (YjgF/YER057c/UK114 family)